MEPDRWRRVADLFHAALERPPAARDAFLEEACAGDRALLDEVQALLARHRSGDGFLETPAAALAGPPDDDGAPFAGRRLGPYRLREVIGRGGMGIVYRAEDTRLGRTVAVKALAPQFTSDAGRRERLRREARAAAALSHPGIATVHALEEVDGDLFIVGEYVEGETLRAEVARGPLALDTLVATALAVASALAAAHGRGIVHRDLKPENIIRGRDGAPKILDFGLARVGAAADGAPVLATLTESGAIAGTPAYMAPEQLRGGPTDFRTDIFAFGTLLYELASGVHPFAGRDVVSTIAGVLDAAPPPLADRCPFAPDRLSAIVERALRKRPEDRYQATGELVADLEALQRELRTPAGETPPPPRAARGSARWWWQFHQVAAGGAVLAMTAPLWQVREWMPGAWGRGLFFSALAVALVAATLRLHLWFTSRYFPPELAGERRRTGPWARRADVVFALLLATAAARLIAADHLAAAALFVAAAVALAVTAAVIEPATTRAAFGR